jgi:hypothetical protein
VHRGESGASWESCEQYLVLPIDFELEVEWSHENDVRGGNVFTFTLAYDEIAWTESQRILGGLRGVLP